jgi:hypothetical protein
VGSTRADLPPYLIAADFFGAGFLLDFFAMLSS